MIDSVIGWLSFFLYYASPAVAFGLAAMAWQRHPQRPFLLFALSSMLMVLLVAVDAALGRHELDEAANLSWWRCRNVLMIIDGILYPWSLYLVFKFIRDNTSTSRGNPDEPPPS
jgi:hypothetical protein